MNDIEILEEIKNIFIHLKNYGWINDIKRDVNTDNAICAIENLINRNKELEAKLSQYNKIEEMVSKITDEDFERAIKRVQKEYIPTRLIDETIEKIRTGKIKIYPNSDPSFAAINILERLKGEKK